MSKKVDVSISTLKIGNPMIKTNPYITNRLAILSSYAETEPWLFNNFTNFWMHKDYDRSYLADLLYFSAYRFCPFLDEFRVEKKLIMKKWDNIIEVIIDIIDAKGYISMNINTTYIKAYLLPKDTMHDIFIYGYDKEKKTLNVADFFGMTQYSFEEVSFDDFNEAYENLHLTNQYDFLHGVNIIYYNSDQDYKLDIDFITDSISDYLLSRNTKTKSILQELDNEKKVSYGISVYDEMTRYLKSIILNNKDTFIDYRVFHYFYEHKVLMTNRIIYLIKKGYINDKSDIKVECEKVENDSLKLRNMILKYQLNYNKRVLDKAIYLMQELKISEEITLFRLLNIIKKKGV